MYNDCVANIQDTSRNGTYHNKGFKHEAEKRGLIISRSEKYGWSHTEPSESLFYWVCDHDELREIEMNRNLPTVAFAGAHSNNGGLTPIIGTNPNSHSRKYQCPCCGNSVRATKIVHIACLDCHEEMIEV